MDQIRENYHPTFIQHSCRSSSTDVNTVDEEGKTSLIWASFLGQTSKVLQLIRNGVDVNMRDHKGNTALIHGVKHEDVVQTLIIEGKALLNTKNREGRTALFYAIIEPNSSARYLLDNGANPELTDNIHVNILSFFIHHCINAELTPQQINKVLHLLLEKGIDKEAIAKEMINASFCKLPLCIFQHSISTQRNIQLIKEILCLANAYIERYHLVNFIRKNALKKITSMFHQPEITLDSFAMILKLMVKDLNANPNAIDETGNTILHYLALSNLRGISYKVLDILHNLEMFGLDFNKGNARQETPLLFFLLNAIKIAKEDGCYSGIHLVVAIILKNDTSAVDDTLSSGETIFHLIIQLLHEGLLLSNVKEQNIFVSNAINLFQLLAASVVNKTNAFDDHLNTPLHLWASLSLSSNADYSAKVTKDYTFEELLGILLQQLLNCGATVNPINQNEETPLHHCKTWSAVRLLVNAGGNTTDLDSVGRSPLLVSAQDYLFLKKPNRFYPDVTMENAASFWKAAKNMGFDLWVCDKNGDSIITHLIAAESFVLAKALVEVACDESNNTTSVNALVGVLNAICKDKSTRTTWKSSLIGIILKSAKTLLDVSSSLEFCCINVKEQYAKRSLGLSDFSVHLQIAKQLLGYGADKECCLKIAEGCPQLIDLLTKPLNMDEVPLVIPWTSNSKRYETTLAGVSRRQNCDVVQSFWYDRQHIASGSFGHVFAGININDGIEVAIKRIETLRMKGKREDKREIQSFTQLPDCKQVVHYLAFFEIKEFSYVILELMEGNLNEYFGSDSYDPDQTTNLCRHVALGLKYLHERNIIHRDMKPSNILYKTYPKLCLKIADFGLSRRLDVDQSISVMGTGVGTRGWIAPEVVKSTEHEHSKASDVFSCGLIFHYILSPQVHPFNPVDCSGKSDLQINIEREGNVLSHTLAAWDSSLHPESCHLVKCMLNVDEGQRPTAQNVLEHLWFWSNKKKMDLLNAVGNQPEFECPHAKRIPPLSAVEIDIENRLPDVVKFGKWDDARYRHMPGIISEMTKRVTKINKKGKTYTTPCRHYDTGSVAELVRLIRNTIAHIADVTFPKLLGKQILEDFVFLDEFPHLAIEVFKAVMCHGWDAREEIKQVIINTEHSNN